MRLPRTSRADGRVAPGQLARTASSRASAGRGWRAKSLALLCGLVLGAGWAARAEPPAFSEHEIKAAWLFNFARFVEWPTNAFTNATAPLVVGVVGRDPFGKELEKAFVGKIMRNRPVLLKRAVSDAELAGCHLLFVGSSERRRVRELTERLRGVPVLTVGQSEEFLDQGGVIKFVLKENAVRFEIDVKAAQRASLRLDANLLKVAVSVRGRYE